MPLTRIQEQNGSSGQPTDPAACHWRGPPTRGECCRTWSGAMPFGRPSKHPCLILGGPHDLCQSHCHGLLAVPPIGPPLLLHQWKFGLSQIRHCPFYTSLPSRVHVYWKEASEDHTMERISILVNLLGYKFKKTLCYNGYIYDVWK